MVLRRGGSCELMTLRRMVGLILALGVLVELWQACNIMLTYSHFIARPAHV